MSENIVCSVCGFRNRLGTERCVSCGAKIEAFEHVEYSAEEQAARRYQQDSFEWKWTFITLGLYVPLQAIALAFLPIFISTYDPQGIAGLGVSVIIWFVGGIIVSMMSPGKTFLEPAVAVVFALVPTIGYLAFVTPDGFEPSFLAYVVGGVMGAMIALFGALLGERLQGNRA